MKELSLPGSWNEFSVKELRYLVKLAALELSPQECKIKMMLYCLGATVKKKSDGLFVIKIGKQRHAVSPEWVNETANYLDFLFTEPDDNGDRFILPRMTRNPLPAFKCRFRTLTGVADGLTEITYNQFIMLQTYQSRLKDDPTAIDYFISVLYSFRGKSSCRYVKHLPADLKVVVFWFYLGCLDFITEKFPLTFSGGGEGVGSVYENQMRVVNSLASGDVTRKTAVRESNLFDALFVMEMACEDQEKIMSQPQT